MAKNESVVPEFTEFAYGITRRKVTENGVERVRSYLVEFRYDPELGVASPATLTLMEDSREAANHFKVQVTKNVFKF